MKTFDKQDVYSWSHAEEAKKFLHQSCCLADSFKELERKINNGAFYNLSEVEPDNEINQIFGWENDHARYALCLPFNKVKEVKEKKWRAFRDYQEFTTWTGKSVGDVIYFRNQNNKEEQYISLIIGFVSLTKVISIGKDNFSLFQLFNYYEWLNDNNEWQPFGIED